MALEKHGSGRSRQGFIKRTVTSELCHAGVGDARSANSLSVRRKPPYGVSRHPFRWRSFPS